MGSVRALIVAMLAVSTLAGCQFHLPPLETSPDYPGPNITDAIGHVQCELAQIVNTTPDGNSDDPRLMGRMHADHRLIGLLRHLTEDHFVATAQITLEVTDAEGLSPSLSFINVSGTLAGALGGQLTGSQDRSLTINYAIDLETLKTDNYRNIYCKPLVPSILNVDQAIGLSGGIAGDLGLADIIADGLLALSASADNNWYGPTGPTPPVSSGEIHRSGTITDQNQKPLHTISGLAGTIVFSPQAAGVATQGSVLLTGVVTLDGGPKFVINWTGNMVPPANGDTSRYFTLTGNLTPVPGGTSAAAIVSEWGFNPTVSLVGSVDRALDVNSINLVGTLSPVTGSTDAKNTIIPAIIIGSTGNTKGINTPAVANAAAAPAKAAASAGASAGGTSFGSLVDFMLVYGINGGPTWSFKTFKGPAVGSTPLFTTSRTNTDSISITFVASCQASQPATVTSYWQSLPVCDQVPTAKQQGLSIGYQNNSLMILRNAFTRSPAIGP